MVGACKGLVVHWTTALHAVTRRSSELGPHWRPCDWGARASSCRLRVLFRESVGVLLKDSTWTCIFDAWDEGSHAAAAPEFAAPVHSDTSSPSDGHRHRRLVAGSGCVPHLEAAHRLLVVDPSNRSLRQDSANLAKQVAQWRREAKRACTDLQLAEQDTITHGKEGNVFSRRCGLLLHCEGTSKGAIGAAALTDLLQINAFQQSIMHWEIRAGACAT